MAASKALLKGYLQHLTEVAQHGDATRESFYGALSPMLEEVAKATGRPQVHVTSLPKSTDAGNPDFRLWRAVPHLLTNLAALGRTIELQEEIDALVPAGRWRPLLVASRAAEQASRKVSASSGVRRHLQPYARR